VAGQGFEELYAGCCARLVRQLYPLTGDIGASQDLAQEAFARAYARWDRVSTLDDPEAWVRTVAFRLAVSRWRRLRSGVVAYRRHGVTASTPELSPDHVALVTAMRALPTAQREALVLHHLVGLPVDEVAQRVGSPVGTVKARLARGRAALAPLLQDTDHDTSSEVHHA
jgi:RNA polymerase sigma-70 factor (ECF subfamily)